MGIIRVQALKLGRVLSHFGTWRDMIPTYVLVNDTVLSRALFCAWG